MKKECRRAVIAGNWKMNKNPEEAAQLIEAIKAENAGADNKGVTVVCCVPYVDIHEAVKAAKGSFLHIGAENCHWEKSGAFTGEISADMLVACGVEYVIIGHSERRQYFGETDLTVNKRVKAALEAGLQVILCVGELLEQREQGITEEIINMQVKIDLAEISEEQMKNVIIAYEPVWAIGTGRTATAEQADEVCGEIRKTLAKLYSPETAEATTIQYGGSMNAKNCAELLGKEHVDGGMIGGASLKAPDFTTIIAAAR